MTGTKKTKTSTGTTLNRMNQWLGNCLKVSLVVVFALTAINCGPSGQEVKTTPEPAKVEPVKPSIEELRQPVAKDPNMFKAVKVLKHFGRHEKKHISYKKFQELTGGNPNAAVNPDWFYDNYVIDMNEKGYWINVICQTSKKAMENDPRIGKVMKDLPVNSITIKLQTPKGKKYMLNDSQADGILDFVKEANKKTDMNIDIKLLDRMQEKYTWIMGLVKKHYAKLKK